MTAAYLIPNLPPARLLENAVQGTRSQIIARLAGNGDAARFGRMLELPVAPPRRVQIPAVVEQLSNHLSDLHAPVSLVPLAFP